MSAAVNGRRVAVIGGSGFIGSHLTERLVADGADVLAVARTDARLANLAAVRSDCVIALADICDPPTMIRVLRRFRPEIVFFLAAHPDGTESFLQISECVRTNGIGLINALQAAVAAGADVFVYGDSAKDYGNAEAPYRAGQTVSPVCSYAIVKSAGWQLCQLVACFTPMKTVALRPTLIYGPRQNRNVITHVRDCVASGSPVRLMGGSQTRDPLYVGDAVRAYVAAAVQPEAWGQAIPIGGGQEVTVTALCEATINALGGSVPVVEGAEPSRLTEIWRSASNNADAARLLGWHPEVPLSEGLSRTVQSWAPGHRPLQSAAPTPHPACYLLAAASGVVYRMLDRRDVPDRRATSRGGRRADDLLAAAVIGEHTHPDAGRTIPFRSYTRASGESR